MPYLVFIPFIQMVQPDTREAVTAKAESDIGVYYLLAVLDSTYDAGFRFVAVIYSATGAWFLSLVYARQRRQFIPQGAIRSVEIVVVFVDLFDVISISCEGYVSTSSLNLNTKLSMDGVLCSVDWPLRHC